MAGSCTGLGVRLNRVNEVEAAVDRIEVWPYAGSASDKSGIRVDPDSGLLWSPPDQKINVIEAPLGPNRTIFPNDNDTIKLIDLSLEMVASPDHDQVMFWFSLAGGFAGYRMGPGNFWGVYRHITTYNNGVPITFSGFQEVSGSENNTTGVSLGNSSTIDSFVGIAERPGGTKFKVLAHYELRPLAFTDRPTNAFTWRPPRLQIMQFSQPQAIVTP